VDSAPLGEAWQGCNDPLSLQTLDLNPMRFVQPAHILIEPLAAAL